MYFVVTFALTVLFFHWSAVCLHSFKISLKYLAGMRETVWIISDFFNFTATLAFQGSSHNHPIMSFFLFLTHTSIHTALSSLIHIFRSAGEIRHGNHNAITDTVGLHLVRILLVCIIIALNLCSKGIFRCRNRRQDLSFHESQCNSISFF